MPRIKFLDQRTRQTLDPLAAFTCDWVHTLFQHGVFHSEVEGLLKVTKRFGVTRQRIQDFLRDEAWQFPQCSRSKNKQLHRIFDERRVSAKEADKLKCTCAEAMGVCNLLRFTCTHQQTGSPSDPKGMAVALSDLALRVWANSVERARFCTVSARFFVDTTVGDEAELAQNIASFRALCNWLDCGKKSVRDA